MNPDRPRYTVGWDNASYAFAWLAFLGSLLYVIASYSLGRMHYTFIRNADALFVPVFYRDVLARGSFRGWDLPVNPYFFPDMLLFIPIDLIANNINLSIPLYGAAQWLLMGFGWVLVQRHLFGKNRCAQTLVLSALTLCVLFIATGRQIFYPYPLMSYHHFGVLVLFPFATIAIVRVLQRERVPAQQRRAALILFALTFITSLSDSLFIVQFVVPAFLVLLLWRLLWRRQAQVSWRQVLLLAGGLLLFAAIGQWLRQFMTRVDKLSLYTDNHDWDSIAFSFSKVIAWGAQVASSDPLLTLFWLSSLIALIVTLVMAHIRPQRIGQTKASELSFVVLLLLISMIVSVSAAILSGNFHDTYSDRYLLPTIYLPLFTGWPLLLAALLPATEPQKYPRQQVTAIGTSLFSLLAIVYMLLTVQPTSYAAIAAYQDPFMQCLERETAQRHLRYGIAGYWQANVASALSNGKLHVVPVDAVLAPLPWNTKRARYQVPFEFVILVRDEPAEWHIQEEVVLQKFGAPAESFKCENSEIYVYNRPFDLQIRDWFANRPEYVELAHVGDQAEFQGYALPSAIHGVTIGLSQGASEQWGNQEGLLAYLPLQKLPAGHYAVALHLFAGSANTASWDTIAFPDRNYLHDTEMIEASGKQIVTGDFELIENTDVEIRIGYEGHGTLFVDKIQVKHINPAQDADFSAFPLPTTVAGDATEAKLSLIYPPPGSRINDQNVDFVWQWTGQPLPNQQTFEVRLWQKGEAIHYGAHDVKANAQLLRQVGDTYILRLDLGGAYSVHQHGAGDYEWTVGIVAIEPAYQDLQIEAPSNPLSLLP